MGSLLARALPNAMLSIPENLDERKKLRIRKLVAKNARGNFMLHLGKYITKADMDDEYNAIKDQQFTAKDR